MRELFDFQEECVQKMIMMEKHYTLNKNFDEYRVLSNVGILSNDVGSGKTSIVLSHIKRRKTIYAFCPNEMQDFIYDNSTLPKDVAQMLTTFIPQKIKHFNILETPTTANLLDTLTETKNNLKSTPPYNTANRLIITYDWRNSFVRQLETIETSAAKQGIVYNFRTFFTRVPKLKIDTTLVIIPHNIYLQWKEETAKFELNVKCIGTKRDFRNFTKEEFENYDMVLCNSNKMSELIEYVGIDTLWSRIIIDEPDTIKIKNHIAFKAEFVWAVTTTYKRLIKHTERRNFITGIFKTMDFNTSSLIQYDQSKIREVIPIAKPNKIFHISKTPFLTKLLLKVLPTGLHKLLFTNDFKGIFEWFARNKCRPHRLFNREYDYTNNYHEKLLLLYIYFTVYQEMYKHCCMLKRIIKGNTDWEYNRDLPRFDFNYKFITTVDPDTLGLADYEKRNWNRHIKEICNSFFIIKCICDTIVLNNRCFCCDNKVKHNTGVFRTTYHLCNLCWNEYGLSNNSRVINTSIQTINKHVKTNLEYVNAMVISRKSKTMSWGDDNDTLGKIIKPVLFNTIHKDIKLHNLRDEFARFPDNKKLVFSNSNVIFDDTKKLLNDNDIKYRELKGNPNTINSVLKKFKNKDITTLLLNMKYFSSGINLQTTEDIYIVNYLNKETETQVIGRANRYGRSVESVLNVHYFFYEEERDLYMKENPPVQLNKHEINTFLELIEDVIEEDNEIVVNKII